jgi:type VI secretion system lysozyme-like protein
MASYIDILAPSRIPDQDGRRSGPADLETCIRFDINSLLNARRPPDSLTDGFGELPLSIMAYGLRDFAFAEMKHREEREILARHLESVISVFEPRLINVHVESVDPEPMETHVNFHIAATVRGTSGDSIAGFENNFEWTTGHHEVSTA